MDYTAHSDRGSFLKVKHLFVWELSNIWAFEYMWPLFQILRPCGAVTIFGLWNWFRSGLGRNQGKRHIQRKTYKEKEKEHNYEEEETQRERQTKRNHTNTQDRSYLAPRKINFRGRKSLRPPHGLKIWNSGHIYSNPYILLNSHTNECFNFTELPRSI